MVEIKFSASLDEIKCWDGKTMNSCETEVLFYTFFTLFKHFLTLGSFFTVGRELLQRRVSLLYINFNIHNFIEISQFVFTNGVSQN